MAPQQPWPQRRVDNLKLRLSSVQDVQAVTAGHPPPDPAPLLTSCRAVGVVAAWMSSFVTPPHASPDTTFVFLVVDVAIAA